MREIILDTETTGLDPADGNRIIELAMIELIDRRPTGNGWLRRFNPEFPIHPGAFRAHGIKNEDLKDEPRFRKLADEVLAFIGYSPIIAHKAEFDASFLNSELEKALPNIRKPAIEPSRWICTLELARRALPGKRNTLSAIAQHYKITGTKYAAHSAWGDVLALAAIYPKLLADLPQPRLDVTAEVAVEPHPGPRPVPLAPLLTEAEHLAHEAMLSEMYATGTSFSKIYWDEIRNRPVMERASHEEVIAEMDNPPGTR